MYMGNSMSQVNKRIDKPYLKPCPFCGIDLINDGSSVIWYHPMTECILSKMGLTPDRFDTWNTRIDSDSFSKIS